MTREDAGRKIESYISKLSREDSLLGKIRRESDLHREEHGCDVHPSDPLTGRLLDVLVRATSPRRVLEVGCGLGYSAIWLARATPPGARVDTIEQDPQHAGLANGNLKAARVERRVRILTGGAGAVLSKLKGPYDFIFEDATYGKKLEYYADLIRVLRVGGCIVFANWFPIEPAIVGGKQLQRWKQEFTPWDSAPERTKSFVQEVAWDPRLSLVLIPHMWKGIGVKIRS